MYSWFGEILGVVPRRAALSMSFWKPMITRRLQILQANVQDIP